MGDTERPIPDRLADQHEQAQHLTRTGNGPTVPNEEELLAEAHGPADMAGFYTGPELVDQDAEPAADVDGEAADQDAADTAGGGESA
ncbi:hypothetical protein ACGFWE_14000 [Streptomyces sp. NPDC048523]|uniref:hypothetical protein n=1 Tax=Streptomyces sp. NPDC048523 TaxID=3365567 RepID=UPI00371266A5